MRSPTKASPLILEGFRGKGAGRHGQSRVGRPADGGSVVTQLGSLFAERGGWVALEVQSTGRAIGWATGLHLDQRDASDEASPPYAEHNPGLDVHVRLL